MPSVPALQFFIDQFTRGSKLSAWSDACHNFAKSISLKRLHYIYKHTKIVWTCCPTRSQVSAGHCTRCHIKQINDSICPHMLPTSCSLSLPLTFDVIHKQSISPKTWDCTELVNWVTKFFQCIHHTSPLQWSVVTSSTTSSNYSFKW